MQGFPRLELGVPVSSGMQVGPFKYKDVIRSPQESLRKSHGLTALQQVVTLVGELISDYVADS